MWVLFKEGDAYLDLIGVFSDAAAMSKALGVNLPEPDSGRVIQAWFKHEWYRAFKCELNKLGECITIADWEIYMHDC